MLTGSGESAAALQTWVTRGPDGAAASVRVLRFRAGSDAAVVAPGLSALHSEQQQQGSEPPAPLVLVHDLVEGSGLIRQGALQEALLARDLLGPQALVPYAFRAVVQCLDAPGLVTQNRLDPANTLGLKLEALDGLGVGCASGSTPAGWQEQLGSPFAARQPEQQQQPPQPPQPPRAHSCSSSWRWESVL